ncbi:hypothetical protein GQR58_025982 [Nymphon striatum]|nr:hypothetical protein GQR58_025982 [Nymphon striatum]
MGQTFILIMVLERNNITGGVNHIYDEDKRMVFGSVLTEQGDAVLLDDRKVWHGVSEVYPIDESKPAYRDVLVLTFHNQEISTMFGLFDKLKDMFSGAAEKTIDAASDAANSAIDTAADAASSVTDAASRCSF